MIFAKKNSGRLGILLTIFFGVLAWSVLLLGTDHPDSSDKDLLVAPLQKNIVAKEPTADDFDIPRLSERNIPDLSTTLFGTLVTISPTPTFTPLPPARPMAPPLPYAYLGHYRDDDGGLQIYLYRGNEVMVVKPGNKIDETYLLADDISSGLVFTYLPLKEKQVIPIGNTAP